MTQSIKTRHTHTYCSRAVYVSPVIKGHADGEKKYLKKKKNGRTHDGADRDRHKKKSENLRMVATTTQGTTAYIIILLLLRVPSCNVCKTGGVQVKSMFFHWRVENAADAVVSPKVEKKNCEKCIRVYCV